MKVIACLSALLLSVVGATVTEELFKIQDLWSDSSAKLPDEKVPLDRWEAEGIYRLRVHRDVSEDAQMEPENMELYYFRKLYDAKKKAWRVDAYPLGFPEEEELLFRERPPSPTGTFILWVHGDEAYLIEESELSERRKGEKEDEIDCYRVPMKFQQRKRLFESARYRGLTFENNHLCHRYTHLNWEEEEEDVQRKGRCKVEHSELYIDIFDHEPVELYLEGTVRHQEGKRSERYRFNIDVMVRDFEFGIEDGTIASNIEDSDLIERELLTMPPTLKRACKSSSEMSSEKHNLFLTMASSLM